MIRKANGNIVAWMVFFVECRADFHGDVALLVFLCHTGRLQLAA